MTRFLLGLVALLAVQTAQFAAAEDYVAVEGSLEDTTSGDVHELAGALSLVLFEPDPEVPSDITVYLIEDFELQAGDSTFEPALPIEYEGETPVLFLQIADHLNVESGSLGSFGFRSGGAIVDEGEDEVTFRFLDFRPASNEPGAHLGAIDDAIPPEYFELEGVLVEVDQTFRIVAPECPGDQAIPPPNGGGVIIGGSSVSIGGSLASRSGGIPLIDPAGLAFANTSTEETSAGTPELSTGLELPTLEELSIRAPDGAEVAVDEAGVLVIESSGDLFLEGPILDLSGFAGLRIIAGGRIDLSPEFRIETDGTLEFIAGSEPDDGGGVVIGPTEDCGVIVFDGLLPVRPAAKREIGPFRVRFEKAGRAVEVVVAPLGKRSTSGPQRLFTATIFGSAEIDVRDIDDYSLRLGPNEDVPAMIHRGRPWLYRKDLNRDGVTDLIAAFDLGSLDGGGVEAGTELCLTARTLSGERVEGCD